MSRISAKIKAKIRLIAKNRCGYCLLPQDILSGKLEIEHILPTAKGGTDDEENLWLSCRDCNSYKSYKISGFDTETKQNIKLFNPRTQDWREHFKFDESKAIIIGQTGCGRATVNALRMNEEQAVKARMIWVKAGWYPPTDLQ
jgi:HNH endonuclease